MKLTEAIFKTVLHDADFRAALKDFYRRKVYAQLRRTQADERGRGR